MTMANKILYAINVDDVQQVARQELGRELTTEEITEVENHIGDQLDWFGAIATVLEQRIAPHEITK
jgi:hypothetical protein